MNDKALNDFKKLSFLGFIIVADTAMKFDHISTLDINEENQVSLTMTNGQLIKLSVLNSMVFLDQVCQIVAAVQLAQARAQSNILV